MSLIHHNPGMTPRQLCSAFDVLPPNMVGQISLMQQRDLLARVPDPDNGCATARYLTPPGNQLMWQAEQTAAQLNSDAGSNLTATQAKT